MENIEWITVLTSKLTTKTYIISRYADDISLYLKIDEQLIVALDIVSDFCSVSGLRICLF